MVPRVRALLCASLIAGASLGGCAGPGAPGRPGAEVPKAATLAPPSAQALVIVGQSTKADVRDALGSAAQVQFDSGWDVWVYRWRGPQRTSRGDWELVILFGPDGIARKTRLRPPFPPKDS